LFLWSFSLSPRLMFDNNDQSYVLRFFLRELFYPERLLPCGELANDNQDPGYDQHNCKIYST
jgi:hypothetical protein